MPYEGYISNVPFPYYLWYEMCNEQESKQFLQ